MIILINIWIGVPYQMLIMTDVLSNLPKDQIESASMDGATPFQIFRHITMPYILFVTGLTLVTDFLIMSEGFDMWERHKTENDYAGFFPDWIDRDVASWVCRDRNHPCIIGWSIGNEIYDTHADERGQEIVSMLANRVRQHDPRCNGYITHGSNYMQWENARKCADILKLAGYNYVERLYDEHHAEHPDWMIYGSETSSVLQSRGIYHFPISEQILTDNDRKRLGSRSAYRS